MIKIVKNFLTVQPTAHLQTIGGKKLAFARR